MSGYYGFDWDYYPRLISSPFIPYGLEYCESVYLLLAELSADITFDVHPNMEDADWNMDCQDVCDEQLYLDLTGNLDAPL